MDIQDPPAKVFPMKDSTYDRLKHLVQYVLPGLGTFYFTIAQIWNLPYGEQVVGTLSALAILIGVIIGVSKKSYDNQPMPLDGTVNIFTSTEGQHLMQVETNIPVEELKGKKAVIMDVNTEEEPSDVVDDFDEE